MVSDKEIIKEEQLDETSKTTETIDEAKTTEPEIIETTVTTTDEQTQPAPSPDESVNSESDSGESVTSVEVLEEPIINPTCSKPYYQDYYLMYGDEEKKYLDIEGTENFLQELGFDGGELKQARTGKESFQIYKEETENPNQMFCSYCGLEITGVEYNRLPDGRLRCTACSRTLVKSEMQELCDRVKSNMESFFGASVNVPIHIEVLEERKLKKKIKTPISVVDDKSILVLGAAVNSKKGYNIYLENGAPRISVIATFAHELTHIWQYINWDNKKGFPQYPRNKKLLIYEGMAKWVEIQYLYLIGETAVAQREEFFTRNRKDEYGIGFRLFEKEYPLSHQTIICNNAPFTKDKYPIDL